MRIAPTQSQDRIYPRTCTAKLPQQIAARTRAQVTLRDVSPWLVVPALMELERRLAGRGIEIDVGLAQLDLEISGVGPLDQIALDLADELHIALEAHAS